MLRSLILNELKTSRVIAQQIFNQKCCFASNVTASGGEMQFIQKDKTSKAMKAYLERAQEHDIFMKSQQQEFEIGKRHLANMMGENPDTFTNQEDIDNAIRYLFPSGLYDKKAKPLMKPPEEVFPQRKAAEFDESGRPHHSMFYTGKPNFFKFLFDIVEHMNSLNSFEDKMIRQQKTVDPALQLDLSGSEWINKEQIETILVEVIRDIEYNNFVAAMDRLAIHPYSYRVREFVEKYRKPLMSQTTTLDIPKLQVDKDGRDFITVYECLRKKARADVTLTSPGTGKMSINGQPITYFETNQCREQQWEIVAFLLSLCSRHQLSCIIDNTVKVVIFHHKQPSTRTVLDCPHSNSFVNMIKYNVIFNEPIYYLSQPPPS